MQSRRWKKGFHSVGRKCVESCITKTIIKQFYRKHNLLLCSFFDVVVVKNNKYSLITLKTCLPKYNKNSNVLDFWKTMRKSNLKCLFGPLVTSNGAFHLTLLKYANENFIKGKGNWSIYSECFLIWILLKNIKSFMVWKKR